jgi:hypothetical protein
MKHATALSDEQRAELEEVENRTLSADEFAARVQSPWSEDELESFAELVSWFQRRYPTPAERLASARALGLQWKRSGA